MRKINWFSRLFMSWDSLVKHIKGEEKGEELETIKNLNSVILKEKENTIDLLKERNNELIIKSQKLNEEVIRLESDIKNSEENYNNKNKEALELNKKIIELRTILHEKQNENHNIHKNISEKLLTLQKMENTFFGSSGNKGKGELGEKRVRTILETSDLPRDFWVENLQVGTKTVEFAIKSGEDGKWIPVDSKVLDPNLDEDNNIIIDKTFAQKIKTQAKEIAKYLSKSNTAGYGIMVLQNDDIYMEVYKEYPEIFREILNNERVHIASPSSFVQFAWSISNIVEIYDKVHQDDKIFTDMISTLESAQKFANKLATVHKEFNIAMNTHHPALVNKQNALVRKLNKSGKLKELPHINGGE